MKKTFYCLLLVVALFLVAGCGNVTIPPTETPTTVTDTPTVVPTEPTVAPTQTTEAPTQTTEAPTEKPTEPEATYTVKWEVNGVVVETDLEVKSGATPSYDGATPTKEATAEYTYTFSAWSPEVASVTKDVTYVAEFAEVKNSYTVTWAVEGIAAKTDKVEYGTVPTLPEAPDKVATAEFTYTFTGWDKEVVAVTGDVTYNAQFTTEKNKYSITWKVEGLEDKVDSIEYGATPSYGETNPTKAATAEYTYAFSGWTPEVVTVVGNATYTAVFTETKVKYSITWKVDGQDDVVKSEEYGATPSYGETNPTKTATAEFEYTFSKWDNEVVAVTGDATYTAVFASTTRKYSITWKVDGQDDVVKSLAYGTTPSYGETNPTKAETAEFTYTFTGWDKDVVNVVADAVYIAEFASAKKSYNITWKVEGLEDKVDSVEYGATPSYGETNPTKAATAEYTYAFSGWTPEVVAVVGNATYTAVFTETKVKYSITWKVDGQDDVVKSEEYGVTPSYGETNPTKASTEEYTYIFSGWTPEVVAVVGNTTYTAVFTETAKPITVTFTAEDNSVLFTREVAKGTELKDVPVAPSKKGYKSAWDTTDFTNITVAKTVKVVYTLATNNVYIANYTAQAGTSVTVQVVVSGDVNFCAYEMTISYGTGLTLTSAKNVSGSGVSNAFNTSVAGQVSASYSSIDNKIEEIAIIELVFTVSDTAAVGDSYAISVTSAEFNTVDASYNPSITEYFVINGKVVVVE